MLGVTLCHPTYVKHHTGFQHAFPLAAPVRGASTLRADEQAPPACRSHQNVVYRVMADTSEGVKLCVLVEAGAVAPICLSGLFPLMYGSLEDCVGKVSVSSWLVHSQIYALLSLITIKRAQGKTMGHSVSCDCSPDSCMW